MAGTVSLRAVLNPTQTSIGAFGRSALPAPMRSRSPPTRPPPSPTAHPPREATVHQHQNIADWSDWPAGPTAPGRHITSLPNKASSPQQGIKPTSPLPQPLIPARTPTVLGMNAHVRRQLCVSWAAAAAPAPAPAPGGGGGGGGAAAAAILPVYTYNTLQSSTHSYQGHLLEHEWHEQHKCITGPKTLEPMRRSPP